MECLFLSGYRRTGKNHSVVRIAHFLLDIGYLHDAGTPIPPRGTGDNFWAVVQHPLSRKRILLNTKSDFENNANQLVEFYSLHVPINILVTSIRDAGPERDVMQNAVHQLGPLHTVEIPLARISGRRSDLNIAVDNYLDRIEKLARFILQVIPFQV
jgi:hypothetical protein